MKDAEKIPGILKEFVDGITKAVGGAGQMVHHHQDPRFIPLYQRLSLIREKTIKIAMKATGIEVKHGKPH